MRRERIIALVAVLSVVFGVTLLAPGKAGAATPQQICSDLQANGRLTQSYSQSDLQGYLAALNGGDATIQGYCPPLVVTPQCVEVPAGTSGAVQAQNGKWFTNAPNGNAEACTTPPAPCTAVPAGTPGAQQASNGNWYANAPNGDANACTSTQSVTCTQVAAGTPGAVQAQNGTWYTNAPNGNAEACATPPAPCTVVPANTPGATQASNGTWYANAPGGNAESCTNAPTPSVVTVPTTGVLGTTKVKQAPTAATAPATKQASPLGTTRSSGTLPFTGAQLTIFAIVGLALVAGGFLLRTTSRDKRFDA
jgi:hypothetical protein